MLHLLLDSNDRTMEVIELLLKIWISDIHLYNA